MALFFSFLVVRTTVLNNILLLMARSCLSITQASSSFKRLDTRTDSSMPRPPIKLKRSVSLR